MNLSARDGFSTVTASLIGIGIGVGVLVLYLVSGIVVAQWDITDFFTHVTLETIGTFLLLGTLTVTAFAIPTIAYSRFHIVTPIVILAVTLLGWFSYSVATGILMTDAVFGLGLYAIGLAPLYFVCYAVAGGVEYYARRT